MMDIERAPKGEGRLAGGLIAGAALLALLVMAHHPTSPGGPEDGHLAADWATGLVHGAMIACVLTLAFGFSVLSRRLGEQYLSVRAAGMAFAGAAMAMTGAALVSGFVMANIAGAGLDPAVGRAASTAFFAVNQALAGLGVLLAALAAGLWAVRMARRGAVCALVGAFGAALGAGAVVWLVVMRGGMGLYAMTHAVLLFAVWSLAVAVQLMRGRL